MNKQQREEAALHKKRKKINKNGWMANLQRWALRSEPRFVGYCPFFWTTFLCILISPFILMGNMIEYMFKAVGEIFASTKVEYKQAPNKTYFDEDGNPVRRLYPMPEASELVEFAEIFKKYKGDWRKMEDDGSVYLNDAYPWVMQHKQTWMTHVEAAKVKVENEKIKRQKIKEREIARRKRAEKIAQYVQYLVKPALFASVLLLGYGAFTLFKFIASLVTLAQIISVGTHMLVISLGVGAATLGIMGFAKLLAMAFTWASETIEEKSEKRLEKPKLKKVVPPQPTMFDRSITVIVETVGFIKEAIVLAYKKECPLIEWTDGETGPIERNPKYNK